MPEQVPSFFFACAIPTKTKSRNHNGKGITLRALRYEHTTQSRIYQDALPPFSQPFPQKESATHLNGACHLPSLSSKLNFSRTHAAIIKRNNLASLPPHDCRSLYILIFSRLLVILIILVTFTCLICNSFAYLPVARDQHCFAAMTTYYKKTNGTGVQVEDTKICVVMVGLPARGKSLIAQKGMCCCPPLAWHKLKLTADSSPSRPISGLAIHQS